MFVIELTLSSSVHRGEVMAWGPVVVDADFLADGVGGVLMVGTAFDLATVAVAEHFEAAVRAR